MRSVLLLVLLSALMGVGCLLPDFDALDDIQLGEGEGEGEPTCPWDAALPWVLEKELGGLTRGIARTPEGQFVSVDNIGRVRLDLVLKGTCDAADGVSVTADGERILVSGEGHRCIVPVGSGAVIDIPEPGTVTADLVEIVPLATPILLTLATMPGDLNIPAVCIVDDALANCTALPGPAVDMRPGQLRMVSIGSRAVIVGSTDAAPRHRQLFTVSLATSSIPEIAGLATAVEAGEAPLVVAASPDTVVWGTNEDDVMRVSVAALVGPNVETDSVAFTSAFPPGNPPRVASLAIRADGALAIGSVDGRFHVSHPLCANAPAAAPFPREMLPRIFEAVAVGNNGVVVRTEDNQAIRLTIAENGEQTDATALGPPDAIRLFVDDGVPLVSRLTGNLAHIDELVNGTEVMERPSAPAAIVGFVGVDGANIFEDGTLEGEAGATPGTDAVVGLVDVARSVVLVARETGCFVRLCTGVVCEEVPVDACVPVGVVVLGDTAIAMHTGGLHMLSLGQPFALEGSVPENGYGDTQGTPIRIDDGCALTGVNGPALGGAYARLTPDVNGLDGILADPSSAPPQKARGDLTALTVLGDGRLVGFGNSGVAMTLPPGSATAICGDALETTPDVAGPDRPLVEVTALAFDASGNLVIGTVRGEAWTLEVAP